VVIGHLPGGLRPGLGQLRAPAIERKSKRKPRLAVTLCHDPSGTGAMPTTRDTLQTTDYSLPAADAHPRVEVRRLSFRRRADVGRCRTPVRSARAMCCLWVMSTMTYVSGVSRSLPLLRWPGQISGPGVLAGARCLASRDQVSTRERSGHGQLQGLAFRLRSARTRPGSSVAGPAVCVSSWSRVRSCDASG
jgi:hypothetical protein